MPSLPRRRAGVVYHMPEAPYLRNFLPQARHSLPQVLPGVAQASGGVAQGTACYKASSACHMQGPACDKPCVACPIAMYRRPLPRPCLRQGACCLPQGTPGWSRSALACHSAKKHTSPRSNHQPRPVGHGQGTRPQARPSRHKPKPFADGKAPSGMGGAAPQHTACPPFWPCSVWRKPDFVCHKTVLAHSWLPKQP